MNSCQLAFGVPNAYPRCVIAWRAMQGYGCVWALACAHAHSSRVKNGILRGSVSYPRNRINDSMNNAVVIAVLIIIVVISHSTAIALVTTAVVMHCGSE